jgi:NodT family efflux transporter outer membrane factor (OMF) lipoprotein
MLKYRKIHTYGAALIITLSVAACRVPSMVSDADHAAIPENYKGANTEDTMNTGTVPWKEYFTDANLNALIDSALKNNQELNISLLEIQMSQNEIRARKGEYLPSLGIGAGAGVEKTARYTRNGALEATTDIKPGEEFPEPLQDYMVGAYASWEIDVWKKLRNAKKAAVSRYLASVEGKNFVVTNLIAEVANSYYELLALDNQLEIVQNNIVILNNALRAVRQQKEATMVTELAVRKFEAEVYKTKSLQFQIQQSIVETENRINFLTGRYGQPIQRDAKGFSELLPQTVLSGIPAQLLENRPDVKQAEQELMAAKIDIKVAKAQFYPSLGISAGIGFQAFNPEFLIQSPQSLLYNLAGDLMAPLVNRNAIKAMYYNANARQIQAVYEYEQTVLNAYIDVANQMAKVNNLEKSYDLKSKQVQALSESIDISISLFRSARADYMEVLMTQRDALEAKVELIETKKQQMNAMVDIYHALGGGWR